MRKYIAGLMVGGCLLLSGCSKVESYLDRLILERSGIQKQEAYETYKIHETQGLLTADGFYSEDLFYAEKNSAGELTNVAHISFAVNNQLDVGYFLDPEFTVEAIGSNLVPGDRIYTQVNVSDRVSSGMYSFQGFRIYQYKNGERVLLDEVVPEEDGFLMEITEEYIGVRIAVEPIGGFEKRVLQFRDYYKDEDGNEHELNGEWRVNDVRYTGDRAEVNPTLSYTVTYHYNSKEYFYEDSEQNVFYVDENKGIVYFKKHSATDTEADYSVKLSQYATVWVTSAVSRKVQYGDKSQYVNKDGRFAIDRLRFADEIIIETDKEWDELKEHSELVLRGDVEKGKTLNYRYVLTYPTKNAVFTFDPSEYSYEHGEVEFTCFGCIVDKPIALKAGQKIHYKQKSAESDYSLRSGYIVVESAEQAKRDLRRISFSRKKQVVVTLPQPEFGGSIEYRIDGTLIKDKEITALNNQTIEIQYRPWNGWHINEGESEEEEKRKKEYKINNQNIQTVFTDQELKALFKEDAEHKPALEMVLDKSIGRSMTVRIQNEDGLDEVQNYTGNFLEGSTVWSQESIGTHHGIILSIGNRGKYSGKAVKILIEKVRADGKTESTYRLVEDPTEDIEPIWVYEKSRMGRSDATYRLIRITVSIVDIEEFREPSQAENCIVKVKNAGSDRVLQDGDVIEPSEQVIVTIQASWDYYLTGKNVENNLYQRTMKYSEYKRNIDRIIQDHPAERYIHITLDSKDAYGIRTYTLDGKAVEGSIRVKEGQKLTLHYEITLPGYEIEESGVFAKTKKSVSITVTKGIDGDTVDRSDFGMSVGRKG